MTDIQKDINELVKFTSEDRVKMFAKAYMKNVFNITNLDSGLEGCAIALCVHDWKMCGKPTNLELLWDYGIKTAIEAQEISRKKQNDEIQKIINRLDRI
jgi:hypothetical protein